jgi:hypothetical protein
VSRTEEELEQSVPLLISMSLGNQAVLCIPAPMVVAELTSYATLRYAGTFAEARQDVTARLLVEEWLGGFIERQEEREVEHVVLGHDDDAFDAEEFFGWENGFVWRPDPVITTMEWLAENEPELASRFLAGDCSTLFDSDPLPFVALEHRPRLAEALRRRGRVVVDCPDLAAHYMDPPFDPARAMSDFGSTSCAPGPPHE